MLHDDTRKVMDYNLKLESSPGSGPMSTPFTVWRFSSVQANKAHLGFNRWRLCIASQYCLGVAVSQEIINETAFTKTILILWQTNQY